MHGFTMRQAWPDNPDRTDDHAFRLAGRNCGRCYLRTSPATNGSSGGPCTERTPVMQSWALKPQAPLFRARILPSSPARPRIG